MSLIYHSTYVQAPSVAPSTDSFGSTYQVRHRRVNLDGGVSLWSPVVATELPATITPQGYSDSDQLLRDEILVSDDFGVTWRVYPGGNVTGAQSVPAFDSGWATTNNQDTQNSVVTSLDFGEFSDTETPSKEVYVVNNGTPINNIKVNFIDLLAGSIATSYMGLLQVSILSTFEQSGVGSSNLYNQSFVWASPQVGLNNLELVLVTGGFVKLSVGFVNYPAPDGLASASISLGMELVANQRTYFLGFGSEWLAESYFVDQANYQANFLSATSSTNVVVGPYLVNLNGVLFTNFGDLNKVVAGADTGYQLLVTSTGDIKVVGSATSLLAGETLLATFDITGSDPWISNVEYATDIKPRDFGKAGGTVAEGRFVNIDSSGNLALVTLANQAVGISLKKDGYYASSGLARVQVSEAVSVGNRLSATTDGKGEVTVSGPVVVLEDGSTDDLVLCNIISIQGPALASVTASQVDVDDSGWTELGPANEVQTALDQTDLLLSGLAEKFTKKFQVFTASGTYTVPAKYVANTLKVTAVGGGAGGAGAGTIYGGGGGGGGGLVTSYPQGLSPGDNVTVTVGAGTAGTASTTTAITGANANNGGSSSFGVYASATGGEGGKGFFGGGDPGGGAGDFVSTLGPGGNGCILDGVQTQLGGAGAAGPGGKTIGDNATIPGGGGSGGGITGGVAQSGGNGFRGEVICEWLEYN
jgi:hypothetical protein